MKTVLFIPGFTETLTSRDYQSTIKAIRNKGYKVKFVPINWKRTAINSWVEELNKEYVKLNPKTTILAGFSFGAMTAFMSAVSRNPAELWLFSLSPYFAEDIKTAKQSWLNYIGKRRVDTFSQLNFNKLAKAIKCKTLVFVGELEAIKYPSVGKRAESAHKLISHNKLIIVPNCGHDVAHLNYIASIKTVI